MNFKTYYINLDTRVDRRINAEQQFDRMGIKGSVICFPAVHRNEKGFQGWMGCRDSHIEIIRIAQRDNLDFVTVFEDDLNFLVTDKKYYLQLFADAGLRSPFSPGAVPGACALPHLHVLYLSANTHQPLRKVGGSNTLYHAQKVRSTSALVYTKEVYARILHDYNKGRIRKIDLYYEMELQPLGHCYVASRLCVTQQNDFSDIEGKQVDYSFIEERFKQYVTQD